MIAALVTGAVAWVCASFLAYGKGHRDGTEAELRRIVKLLEICSDPTAREMRAALELDAMERP